MTADPNFWRDRRVLVTGASGLLGSWLARDLVELDAEPVAVVRDQVGWGDLVLSGTDRRCVMASADIVDLEAMTRLVNEYECTVVLHVAAQAIVGAATRDPVSTFESNIRGTWTVLEASRRARCVDAIVVTSSDKAYGRHEEMPYAEDGELLGNEVYEASKVAAEVVCRPYARTYGLNVGVSRCGNLFGGADLNWSRLVPGTIRSALRGEPPRIRSDGSPVRDYLYVRDGVDGILILAEALSRGQFVGEPFNFSGGTPLTVLEMTDAILKAVGASDLAPVIEGGAADEIGVQLLATEKAETKLGWNVRWDLSDALAETVDWYRGFLHE